ncbi:MAG: type I-E CRISPR-associated protein Cse1/CasA [Alphaproteobacteria bacterium]|nr:type I-E CRISPR-associated protein Cse1/CasA [Alphaproteobacteria bacterium]
MAFNLIHDAWIPVRRAGGGQAMVRPAEVVAGIDLDPVVAVAAPRPDLTGALTELLVGLLAAAATPADIDEWLDWWQAPPSLDDLETRLAAIAPAFDLDGDGPRAFQDLARLEDAGGEPSGVERLLIDAPGDQSLRNNTDLFVRRGRVSVLSRAAAAAALVTLQTYAPGGGRGHRTSLRGGGPLTTLVVPDTGEAMPPLWRTLWANIPIGGRTGGGEALTPRVFPWLAPTRTSEKGEVTTPLDADPLQVFFGLPRRIRLLFEPAASGETCDLYGITDPVVVRGFVARPYGVNYEGGWRHPLTPHNLDKQRGPLPRHGSPGGVSYRYWLGLVQDARDEKSPRQPAACVRQWREELSIELDDVPGMRLRAFGYDMDKKQIMKARCWYDSTMPVLPAIDPLFRTRLDAEVAVMVTAAQEAATTTARQIKAALAVPPDTAVIEERFWRATETAFATRLSVLGEVVGDRERVDAVRLSWRDVLRREAMRAFDASVDPVTVLIKHMARVVKARTDLLRAFSGKGRIAQVLDLPLPSLKEKAGKDMVR